MALTPEEIARLKIEMSDLREEIDRLDFSQDFLDKLEQFGANSVKVAENLKQQNVALRAAQVAAVAYNDQVTTLAADLSLLTVGTAEYDAAQTALTKAEKKRDKFLTEATQRRALEIDGAAKLKTSLLANVDALKKNAKARIAHAKAMALLTAGDIQGAADALDDMNNALKEGAKDSQAGSLAFDALANSLLGLSGPMQKLQGFLSKGPKHWGAFLKGMKPAQLLKDLTWKLLDVSIQYAIELDNVTSQFEKSTGAGEKFNETIKNIERAGRSAGVTFEEAAKATQTLKNTFTDFTYFNQQTQDELGATVSVLAELGFEMQDQAQIMQTATKAMGMSLSGAQNLLLDITATAKSLGIDVKKMGQEFVKNKEILVRYGDRAGAVFEDLAKAAKASGTEVSELLKMMDKFKTFDAAGKSVGRLNAILAGPYLNSIDMLNASLEDPIEGVKMLKSAFEEAGVDAAALSGAELLAFSDALGMSAEETRKLISQSNEELEIERLSREQANEQAEKALAIMDKLRTAFKKMFLDAEPFVTNVLLPMIEGFSAFAGMVGKITSGMGAIATGFVFAALAAAALAMAIPGLQGFSIAALGILAMAGIGGLAMKFGGEEKKEKEKKKFRAGEASRRGFLAGGIVPEPLMGGGSLTPILMNEGNFQEKIILAGQSTQATATPYIRGYAVGGTVNAAVPAGSEVISRKDLDAQAAQREETNKKLDLVASHLDDMKNQNKNKQAVTVSQIKDYVLEGVNPFARA